MRHLPPETSDKIWKRDRGKCVYCGEPAEQIDHVVPFSKGGITAASNSVCACRKCNSKKKGDLKLDYMTRGLYYLASVGENTDWVDRIGEIGVVYTAKIIRRRRVCKNKLGRKAIKIPAYLLPTLEDDTLSLRQKAELLGVSKSTVARKIREMRVAYVV